MMKALTAVIAVAAVICCVSGCASQCNVADKQAARESAEAWLDMIDKGKYTDSWRSASEYFQSAVAKKDWWSTMRDSRKPMGRLVSRTLKSQKCTGSMAGAPDGKYVIIQYSSCFENKEKAVETITPMLEEDGVWRVSGYYIK